jgi:hypothetical protein
MSHPRTLLLFDKGAQPASWNERMSPTEYAILYSSYAPGTDPTCTIFSTLAEAKEYASHQVLQQPNLRCRIYDHQGLAVPPVFEARGEQYKGDNDLSPRFRRWAGSILFFGGIILTMVDWLKDFSLSWPAMIGTRMFPVGMVLLFIELMVIVEAKRKKNRQQHQSL